MVTSDTQFVQRLLNRFFSSSLHCLFLISQPQFMKDFRERTPRYCSEALVNAVLGMACGIATSTSQLISRVSFGDAFIGEAKRLLSMEQNHVNVPSIQALGILALAEMSQGNEDEALDLARESVRACIRLVLQTKEQDHSHDDDFRTVRALAYCGGFSLIRALRLLTGDLEPKTGPLFMRLHPYSKDQGEDAPEARVERGISLQVQFFAELRFCPPLARFIFEVIEAAHTFSTYNFAESMTASDLEGAFNKCVTYHGRFFQSAPSETGSGPDLLFAQIWYHFCLLSLLQPFATKSATLVDDWPASLTGDAAPQAVCRQASKAIIYLTSTHQTRYSLAYLPPLLPYILFAAVLYQLSLAKEQKEEGPGPVESTETPPRQPTYDSPHHSTGVSSFPDRTPSIAVPSEPSSLAATMKQQKAPGQRAASFLAASTSTHFPNNNDQARRLSICSFTSGTASEEGGESSDHSSDMLPTFTSRPADLVTIGSLQLASMGAQHPGAAEAANLLRTVGSVRDLPGSALSSSAWAEPLPPPAPTGGLDISAPLLGLGVQAISDSGAGAEAVSCPEPIPGFGHGHGHGHGLPTQLSGLSPKPPSPDISRLPHPPPPPLFES
ncbi:hypothetical protein VTK56DRAFT_10203 [Thermocarpiscus australiensis]